MLAFIRRPVKDTCFIFWSSGFLRLSNLNNFKTMCFKGLSLIDIFILTSYSNFCVFRVISLYVLFHTAYSQYILNFT
jgi:hypothetical protein